MYNSNALNNFVLNVFQDSQDGNGIIITEEEILQNSISRLDALVPTGLKLALKKISEKTETTMKEHLVKALMIYLENNFDMSNIDMDVITVKKSEYEELKQENKELKKEVKKLKEIKEDIQEIVEENERLKQENKELKKENKKLNNKIITLENKLSRELKKDKGAYLVNEIEKGNIKGYNDIIKTLNLHNSDDIIKFNNKMFVEGYEPIEGDYKLWRFKDSRLNNYVLVGKCRDESILTINDEEIIKNIIYGMKKQEQELEELKNKLQSAKIRINFELYDLADAFPEHRFEILSKTIKNSDEINTFEDLNKKLEEINKWLMEKGFPARIDI